MQHNYLHKVLGHGGRQIPRPVRKWKLMCIRQKVKQNGTLAPDTERESKVNSLKENNK